MEWISNMTELLKALLNRHYLGSRKQIAYPLLAFLSAFNLIASVT